jgi:CheY-like chemotaxis protein
VSRQPWTRRSGFDAVPYKRSRAISMIRPGFYPSASDDIFAGTAIHLQVESAMVPDSPEHCLREAEECDRLAGLSRSVAIRQVLRSVAFHWRKLAERAAERPSTRARRPAAGPATGARVLVVEDDRLVADTLCDLLRGAGCEPVGPADNIAIALDLIQTSRIDAAILDVRLMDEMSYPIAYALRARGIPLVFLTASERGQLPSDLSNEILIEKPFKAPMLIETVRRMARAAMA